LVAVVVALLGPERMQLEGVVVVALLPILIIYQSHREKYTL
jgi:hypothetical protein